MGDGIVEKLGLSLVVLGSLLIAVALIVLATEVWSWYRAGYWSSISVGVALGSVLDLVPRVPAPSESSHILHWLFYQPLDRVLVMFGFALSLIGLNILR